MKSVVYVIPCYKLSPIRESHLKAHKEAVAAQKGVDVDLKVMVQDHIAFPTFNKGWLCNKAVKESTAEWIVIADVDVWPRHDNYLAQLMRFLDVSDSLWCFGWNRLVYEGKDGGPPERDDWPYPGVQEGGIVAFHRIIWGKMGGANEWIKELRGPDNDLAMRALYLTGHYPRFDALLYHHWHPHSAMKQTAFKKNNKGILRYTRQHPKRVLKMLTEKEWGSPQGPYSTHESFFEARTRHDF